MRERGIYPQDCPRTVRSRRNRCGNTELACSPKYHGAKTAYWAVGRQSGLLSRGQRGTSDKELAINSPSKPSCFELFPGVEKGGKARWGKGFRLLTSKLTR